MENRDPIWELAQCCGIENHYYDIWGNRQEVSRETIEALLRAMGKDSSSFVAMQSELDQLSRESSQHLLPVVSTASHDGSVALSAAAQRPDTIAYYQLFSEDGEQIHEAEISLGTTTALPLPMGLSPGYYDLVLESSDKTQRSTLLVSPSSAYWPQDLEQKSRNGVAVQLYSLTSSSNWGIGDFRDLSSLGQWVRLHGGKFLGLNPLHALFSHDPQRCSPYAANSRFALNAQYVRPEDCVGFSDCPDALALYSSAQFQDELRKLRTAEFLNYSAIWRLKKAVLLEIFQHLLRQKDGQASAIWAEFQSYCAALPPEVVRYAQFEALQKFFHQRDSTVWGWPCWPRAYQNCHSSEVLTWCAEHCDEVDFFKFLQWNCERQLQSSRQESGVHWYGDIALCAGPGGAETWSDPELFARGANAGAPPDEFNIGGQDWGTPPMIPSRLTDRSLVPFRNLLRSAMSYLDYLRLDHIMSLQRLYWVPQGLGPKLGAYVRYPLSEMMAVVAIESFRRNCVVIGEDLGTVPEEVRAAMRERKVASYSVVYFMQRDGRSLDPREYPVHSLATISTHDLPTLRGFWEGVDIERRVQLGLPSVTWEDRTREKLALIRRLRDLGILVGGDENDWLRWSSLIADAIHRLVGMSSSRIRVTQIEDLLEIPEQANLPGTVDEHPNWRRRVITPVDRILTDERVSARFRLVLGSTGAGEDSI